MDTIQATIHGKANLIAHQLRAKGYSYVADSMKTQIEVLLLDGRNAKATSIVREYTSLIAKL